MAIAASRKAIAEFVGAFMLIFIGAGAIIAGGNLLLVAFAHGFAIGVMASAFGRISGGHFNPAVTLGALVGRQISARLAAVYWASQLLGALSAAVALFIIFPSSVWQPSHLGTPVLGSSPIYTGNVSVVTGILVEAILTFFLVTVVYGTGIDPKGTFNAVGGFAIGLTISIDIMMGGPLTGAAMNPARWFGPAVISQFFDNWYVYWIGPFLGAIVAGLLYSQFISIFAEKDGKRISRPYSIASWPENKAYLELCIKVVEGGFMSNYLHHVRPGTKLPTIGPLGRFVMQEPIPYDTVFVATGTGVAPFIAMMGHIWERGLDGGREFHMVFGVRYVHDLIYRDLIERWEREHRNFHFYPTISRPETPNWKGRVGYVQKVLENDIKDYANKQVFICGLHDMVEDVNNLCKRLGFAYVRFEKWD